jgi:hypothetical protein
VNKDKDNRKTLVASKKYGNKKKPDLGCVQTVLS